MSPPLGKRQDTAVGAEVEANLLQDAGLGEGEAREPGARVHASPNAQSPKQNKHGIWRTLRQPHVPSHYLNSKCSKRRLALGTPCSRMIWRTCFKRPFGPQKLTFTSLAPLSRTMAAKRCMNVSLVGPSGTGTNSALRRCASSSILVVLGKSRPGVKK